MAAAPRAAVGAVAETQYGTTHLLTLTMFELIERQLDYEISNRGAQNVSLTCQLKTVSQCKCAYRLFAQFYHHTCDKTQASLARDFDPTQFSYYCSNLLDAQALDMLLNLE